MDDKNNFQTSIKGSSRTIPEDPLEDPGRASTEESKTGIERREKPLNNTLIEFQSEAIFGKNSSEDRGRREQISNLNQRFIQNYS